MEKKPTFFWQGALILLPLLLLVVVGLYSLREDKAIAEAEAKERAQSHASEFVRNITAKIEGLSRDIVKGGATNSGEFPTFTVSGEKLLLPPPIPPVKPAVLPAEILKPEQRRLWHMATAAEFSTNHHEAFTAFRDFLGSKPPEQFRASASYSLALLLGNTEEAKRLLLQVRDSTNTTSDAGLPLPMLAHIKLVELAFATSGLTDETQLALNTLCDGAIDHPIALTPSVLELAEKLQSSNSALVALHRLSTLPQAKKRWAADETARAIYEIARPSLIRPVAVPIPIGTITPRLFWIDAEESYLAISDQQLVTHVICYPRTKLSNFLIASAETARDIPEYFGVTAEIAGREIATLNATPWHEESHFSPRGFVPGTVTKKEYLTITNAALPILASAAGSGATETLKVNVVLTNRDALFKTQQARRNWFGVLIFASALVAGSGLWRSWRTFTRQQQLNEMKSNFVSSVSHELRAPIASVRLLAEALDRGAVSEQPKQKEYFRFIVQECRRLTGLIENVLDFSRIEQGRKQYHFEETDLNALVDQTVKLMQPAARERAVELQRSEFNVQSSMFNVVCDGLALQQALINLLDNAIKHSPAGEKVVVELKTGHRTSNEPESCIHLTVLDHGPGIPPEEHDKIFERFYRRGSELRRETQGIGIGLTIVKHVAEAHGGCVLVESAVGKGSTFTIVLPSDPFVDSKHEARNSKSETNPNI